MNVRARTELCRILSMKLSPGFGQLLTKLTFTAAVMACISIANIVKTSLGPVGLDKMLVDDIGDTTVS